VPAPSRRLKTLNHPDNTPYRLLWSAGAVAFALGIVAFLLWGINGAGTLFDMMAALRN
jgi:hypothetical protein